jgi:hypothetical protein
MRQESGVVQLLSEYENPFPGQSIRNADLSGGEHYSSEDTRKLVSDPKDGTVVTSEYYMNGILMHKPVLDIDMPVTVLPSSTPGHYHLFIDKELTWDSYVQLLSVMSAIGILEDGFVSASLARGHTAVRLPWIKKESHD